MKKFSFIIIASVLILFLCGNYFVYRQVLKTHKREFKAYIHSNFATLEILEISPSELFENNRRIIWIDSNKEIVFNNKIYDIVSIQNNGTSVLLKVVDDTQEKELQNKYRTQFELEYNSKSSSKNKLSFKDFFNMKYFSEKSNYFQLFFNYFSNSDEIDLNCLIVHLSVQTPPPNLV